MNLSVYPRCALIFFFLLASGIEARSSAYQRAQDLAEDDPLEAEALYVSVIAGAAGNKLKRAASHDLFSLRLKNGRLTEAFFQARSASFRRRLQSAVEEGVKLSETAARQLIQALRHHCRKDGDAGEIGALLHERKYPVAAYNFAVRVLTQCGVENPERIFPAYSENPEPDSRAIHLALLEVREAVSHDEFESAENLLSEVRKSGAKILAKEPALQMQLDFTSARLSAMKEDFKGLKTGCASIEAAKPPKRVRYACRYLIVYALLKEEKYAEAFSKISTLKTEAVEIDNRLLRLIAAVAAGEEPVEKLERFARRRSYKECAPVLRELAEAVIEKNK